MRPRFYPVETPYGLHYRAENESPNDPAVLERAKRWAAFEKERNRPFLSRNYSPEYYLLAAEVMRDRPFFREVARSFSDKFDENFVNWAKSKNFFYAQG